MHRFFSTFLIALLSLTVLISCTKKEEQQQTSSGGDAKLTYTLPQGWVSEKPSSQMRRAQFNIPGHAEAGDAEMAVFVFPGRGGMVQANIDRWIGQFSQPDGSNSKDKAEIKKIDSNGMPVTLLYLTGTYEAGMGGNMGNHPGLNGFAMMAAIVETASDPWFFKAIGPQPTLEHWRAEFETFAGTFHESQP
ncbi:MAG: hypothetical protein E4H13_00155 [Calditrichales bacterium]|nr:MAG: hypothetical protein E4H13_00155 [Calditrichales bacterium]